MRLFSSSAVLLFVLSSLQSTSCNDPFAVTDVAEHGTPQHKSYRYVEGPGVTITPDPKHVRSFDVKSVDDAHPSKVSRFLMRPPDSRRAQSAWSLVLTYDDGFRASEKVGRASTPGSNVNFMSADEARAGAEAWIRQLNLVRISIDGEEEEEEEEEEGEGGGGDEEEEGDACY